LTDRVIAASTFSQNRRRRFSGSDIEQTIFDRMVARHAIEQPHRGGRVFYSDSTHLKASANKNRHDVHRVEQTPAAYLAELESAIEADVDHGNHRSDDAPDIKAVGLHSGTAKSKSTASIDHRYPRQRARQRDLDRRHFVNAGYLSARTNIYGVSYRREPP
jgi:hypothetical protein